MNLSKYIIYCLSFLTLTFTLHAQSYSSSSTTFSNGNSETISYWCGPWGSFRTISHRNRIYLNNSTEASDSSNIRKLIDIRIPAGTQYWYYAFTTNTPEINNNELRISGKLNDRLVDAKRNKTEPDLTGLEIPQGTDSINVYLLNTENASIFTQGSDNFNYIYEGSVKNRRQGLILVKNNNETNLSFGVVKTGLPGDINVDFDFLFIVDSSMTETGQANNSFQQDFFNNNFFNNNFFSSSMAVTIGNQGWKAFQEGDYDQCLIFSKGALEKDNSLGFVHFNIALVYLIKGQNHKALKKYNEAIEVTLKEYSMKHDLDGAIDDLKTYMYKFPSKKTAYKILNKLTAIADKHN